jgi:hypothetical protein
MKIADIEAELGLRFPSEHAAAMLDSSDPIHDRCDFLVPESPHALLRILEVNESLHSSDRADPWPSYLVAFASNGCGDYFAYDLRDSPPSILYIEPDWSIDENLSSLDQLRFSTFERWYERKLGQRRKH